MEQSVFDLIDRTPALIRQGFQAGPDQQGTGDVIALDPTFPTLALLIGAKTVRQWRYRPAPDLEARLGDLKQPHG